MRKEYGGCAGNIAYNLKLLGGHPVPVATVGDDAADYLERFAGLGIDTSRLRVMPGTFTAQCFITTDLEDNQIAAFHPGAMELSAQNDLSGRSEEHTSELQTLMSISYAVFCLKKKNKITPHTHLLHTNNT